MLCVGPEPHTASTRGVKSHAQHPAQVPEADWALGGLVSHSPWGSQCPKCTHVHRQIHTGNILQKAT